MTPKEKSQELFDKMINEIEMSCDDYYTAKKCALIAIEEILDELTSRGILSGFWYEVKQEIEKL